MRFALSELSICLNSVVLCALKANKYKHFVKLVVSDEEFWSEHKHVPIVYSMWAWVIIPLVLGWGTGPEKNQIPRVLALAVYWNLVFFCFLGPG